MNGLIYHIALQAKTDDQRRAASAARSAGPTPRRRRFRRSF
jgi:hypothetical protein